MHEPLAKHWTPPQHHPCAPWRPPGEMMWRRCATRQLGAATGRGGGASATSCRAVSIQFMNELVDGWMDDWMRQDPFWFNVVTHETAWDPPPEFINDAPRGTAAGALKKTELTKSPAPQPHTVDLPPPYSSTTLPASPAVPAPLTEVVSHSSPLRTPMGNVLFSVLYT